MKKSTSIERLSNRLEDTITSMEEFQALIENRSNAYNGMIFDDLKISFKYEDLYDSKTILKELKLKK